MRIPRSTPGLRAVHARIVLSLALVLTLTGCGSGGGAGSTPWAPPGSEGLPFATLGELEDAIAEASVSPIPEERIDTDGDSIQDVVEARLGTAPGQSDTDRDGLVDGAELFADGWRRPDPLPDQDRDRLIAPSDADDDGDAENDGMRVDTDFDGVSNFLELYGYTFNFLTGRFEPWNGNPEEEHFFTDPLQPSTDQDAYPDGMEASHALEDPTVREPGDDPLVPAYPNLVCELVSYSVTLNEEVQVTESESFSKGQTWNRQTDQTWSHRVQNSWEVGAAAEVGSDVKVTVSGKYGQAYENTNSTTTSIGTGGSITNEAGWSSARSTNPTRAALLKLYVRVHNRGTAPVSHLVPTLALRIGGLNVATFEPAGANVNLLVPGATYPAEPGWLWVIEAKNTGGGTEPLYLTMSELRALERGAPISLAVTQVAGDAMRLSSLGTWESVGDTNEFTARCDAVCANLKIELEDGSFVNHLVYAGEGPSAPVMTLGEALAKVGVDAAGTLHYLDEQGVSRTQSIDGFRMQFDAATLRANQWTLAGDDPTGATETASPPGFVLYAMRLLADSVVNLRAPRPATAPVDPVVHFSCLDSDTGEMLVSAADYEGIASVVVHNEFLPGDEKYREQALTESVPGAGFFVGNAHEPGGFVASDQLTAVIRSLEGIEVTRALGSLYIAPGPQKPEITEAKIDRLARRIHADVVSGNPDNPNSSIDWIRAYHPDFDGGYVDMRLVFNYYLYPNRYEAELPLNFGEAHPQDVEVVAYVQQDCLTIAYVAIGSATAPRLTGSSNMHPVADGTNNFLGVQTSVDYTIPLLELDQATLGSVLSNIQVEDTTSTPVGPGVANDLFVRMDFAGPYAWARMFFSVPYTKHTLVGRSAYDNISRDDILAAQSEMTSGGALRLGTETDADMLRPGEILLLMTSEGRPAKLFIENASYNHNTFTDQWWADSRVHYEVHEAP